MRQRVLWNSLGAGSPTLGSDMHAKLDDSMENNEQVQDYPKCHHAFPLPVLLLPLSDSSECCCS